MAHFSKEAGAALAIGIVYLAMWSYMLFMYFTHRYKWASRFTILFVHTTIRVASQACGVAFGILAFENTDVFVAYLILGAEGYFSLTVASYYFLKAFHHKHFQQSFLGPLKYDKEGRSRRFFESLFFIPLFTPWRYWRDNLILIVDAVLIPANAIIITGGSYLAGVSDSSKNLTQAQIDKRLDIAKGLRTTGQSMFFAVTVLFAVCIVMTARKVLRHGSRLQGTLISFTAATVFLHLRGIFGVLQSAIYGLSYYNPENYNSQGFTDRFTALEYCLGVMPEFCAAALLNLSYWTNRAEIPILSDNADIALEHVHSNTTAVEPSSADKDKV